LGIGEGTVRGWHGKTHGNSNTGAEIIGPILSRRRV
jgi:hypothetical protein